MPDLATLGPDLYSLHRANGDTVYAGSNARRVFDIAPEKLMDRGFMAGIHVQDRVSVAKAINDCLAIGRQQKAQFRLVTSGGTDSEKVVRWFELRCEPAPKALPEQGEVLALAVTRDISERRMLEAELQRQREKADSANVAKTRFLANMSHELRTPLNAILGFSELLNSDAMGIMPPERSREYVELIHSSATHLLTVVNDVLDMSRIEAGKYDIVTEPFDIGQTVRGICAMLRGQAEQKDITLVAGEMEELPEITADQRAIRQITINLLSNAIKFTQEGGNVGVHLRRRGRNVQLEISDDGIGISAEHMASLGQPFYQADSRYDRKYEGSGLGLSVVRGLVELHHGSLSFKSEKGSGTRVIVEIPIMPPDAPPVPASEQLEIVNLRDRKEADRRSVACANRRTA